VTRVAQASDFDDFPAPLTADSQCAMTDEQ
jgi:hypothetical protein